MKGLVKKIYDIITDRKGRERLEGEIREVYNDWKHENLQAYRDVYFRLQTTHLVKYGTYYKVKNPDGRSEIPW